MVTPPEIPTELREAGEGERKIRSTRAAVQRSAEANRLVQVSAIGTEFAVAVVGAGALGYLIDLWLGWSPWGLLVGCVLGLVWGFTRFIRTGLAMARGGSAGGGSSRGSGRGPGRRG